MILEMDKLKAYPAHGTREALKNNENIEYMMAVKRDTADWDRWINNYCKKNDIF